jgi:hypothetical protein
MIKVTAENGSECWISDHMVFAVKRFGDDRCEVVTYAGGNMILNMRAEYVIDLLEAEHARAEHLMRRQPLWNRLASTYKG